MASMLEKPKKEVKPMTSREVQEYIEDIARQLDIDLASVKDYNEKELSQIFKKMSSLSDEIVKEREK
jgi:hypothetical protein